VRAFCWLFTRLAFFTLKIKMVRSSETSANFYQTSCRHTPQDNAIYTTGLEPIGYRVALLSTLLHATVYVYTQFAEYTSKDCK
jgi:hypothetical protein